MKKNTNTKNNTWAISHHDWHPFTNNLVFFKARIIQMWVLSKLHSTVSSTVSISSGFFFNYLDNQWT